MAVNNLRWPMDLAAYEHFINIAIFKYSRENRKRSEPTVGSIITNISLPIPEQVAARYRAEYDNVNVSPAAMAGGMVGEILKKVTKGEPVSETELSTGLGDLAKEQAGGIVWKSLDNTSIGRGLSGALGLARNPHLASIYRGTSFRSFSYSWRLLASSKEESDKIRDIIKSFKKAQAPSFAPNMANSLFEYPDEFMITFNNSDYLYKMKPCILSDMSVSYYSGFHDDNSPVAIDLTLDFSETSIIVKDDIDQGY